MSCPIHLVRICVNYHEATFMKSTGLHQALNGQFLSCPSCMPGVEHEFLGFFQVKDIVIWALAEFHLYQIFFTFSGASLDASSEWEKLLDISLNGPGYASYQLLESVQEACYLLGFHALSSIVLTPAFCIRASFFVSCFPTFSIWRPKSSDKSSKRSQILYNAFSLSLTFTRNASVVSFLGIDCDVFFISETEKKATLCPEALVMLHPALWRAWIWRTDWMTHLQLNPLSYA